MGRRTPFSAVGTGHLHTIEAPGDGIIARQREVKPLVELRVPFELDRQAIDDVERGANDSDWQAVKDAAQQIAFSEDRAIFEGYAAAGIEGIRQGTSNPVMTLPADVIHYPDAIAEALRSIAHGRRQRSLFGSAGRRRVHRSEREPATTDIRFWSTFSAWLTTRLSAPRRLREPLSLPPAAATSICTSAKTSLSAT